MRSLFQKVSNDMVEPKRPEIAEVEPCAKVSMMDLPTELHLHIASYLTYPDALSLKHTNRYFNGWVYTGVNLKIEWLIERRRLHLDCPNDQKCELGSDTRFCRGSVGLLMKRRREHGECDTREGGRGCLVFGTRVCTFVKKDAGWLAICKKKIRSVLHLELVFFWALLGVIGVALAWLFSWKWTIMGGFEI